MKKKNISYLVIVAVILATAVLLFLRNGTDYADDILEFHEAMNAEGQTSIELIDQALEEEAIDQETALKYKVLSVFGSDQLPDAFLSEIRMYEGSGVLRELTEKWDDLSDETKVELEPFRKRPDDPESWVNLMVANQPAETTFIPGAHAVSRGSETVYKNFLVSSDNKVKIWYPNEDFRMREVFGSRITNLSADTAKKMAQQIKTFLDNDNIMEGFEELMEKKLMDDGTLGGDGKLDIYLAPLNNAYGVCKAESGVMPTASFIILDSNIGASRPNLLKTVLAHEIFHAFQFLFPQKSEDAWWAEATAMWSEDFSYPSVNSEHAWIKKFIDNPATSLFEDFPPRNHDYSAYLFAYFMSHNFGDDIIHQTWKACGDDSCLGAIDAVLEGGLKKQWREFTLWNFNQAPAQFYVDLPSFPKHTTINSAEFKYIKVKSETAPVKVDFLNPLSATYKSALNHTDSNKVKQIIFKDLEKFTKNKNASIKAAIRLRGGKDMIEDWTDKKSRRFCIDNPEENIDEVILTFSNGDKKKWIEEAEITIETNEDTCYVIDQKDESMAVLHIPYGDGRSPTIADVNAETSIESEGSPSAKANPKAKYSYMTKWELSYEYKQTRDEFVMDCLVQSGTATVPKGWINRDVGIITFDLSPESLGEDSTFDVDVTMGYPHPEGVYQEVPPVEIKCFALTAAASQTTLPVMTIKNAFKGRIFDMTAKGAKIELLNSCMHNSCSNPDGFEMQTMDEPFILEIKISGK